MFSRKLRFLTLLAIVLAMVVVSGCTTPTQAPEPTEEPDVEEPDVEEPEAEDTETGDEAEEPVTIEFWHHTYTVATDWMREKAAEYQVDHPNVEINIVEYPHGDYEVKLRSAISAGDAPDIINVLDYLFPEFYANGWLAPAPPEAFGAEDTEGILAQFEDPALTGMTFDGQVYGVPAEYNTFVLFLNPDLFAEAGLDAEALVEEWKESPITWDEFFEVVKQVEQRDENGNIEVMGFNWVWGLDPFWYAQQYWNVIPQYGCEVLDDDGNAVINSPECVQAFTETWYRLAEEDMGGPDLATSDPVYAFRDFMDGRQAICMGGPWAPPSWREEAPEIYENYIVAPIPQNDPEDRHSFVHTYALGVSSDSEVADEAWAFLNFLLSDPVEMFTVAGYINGRKGIFEEPQVREALKDADVYAQEYATGTFVWRSETWAEEGDIIAQAIEQFMQDGDVQGALDQAAQEIDAVRGK